MSFQESFVELIETNATKQPSKAQFIVKNPLRARIFVIAIQLTFDAYFSRKGVIMIKINDNIILPPKLAGTYIKLESFPLSLKSEELPDQKKVEVFVWNGIDNNIVSVGVDIQLSEDPQSLVSTDSASSILARNEELSEPQEIFTEKNRINESETKVIDLKGYKKLIVILIKSNPDNEQSNPTITDDFFTNPSNLGNIVDGLVNTTTSLGSVFNSNQVGDIRIDFQSIKVRDLICKVRNSLSTANTGFFEIFTSDDDIVYNLKFTKNFTGFIDETLDYSGTLHSFRYVRLRFTSTNGFYNMSIFEVYDANVMGGTGSISFEIRNPLKNTWGNFIPASEFGTITDGDVDLIEQVGDVNTKSISGKTYALPSTQTDFRAKYSVGGVLKNSVSILRIA